jgi:tetratricopeptide (TPR) repeat protein
MPSISQADRDFAICYIKEALDLRKNKIICGAKYKEMMRRAIDRFDRESGWGEALERLDKYQEALELAEIAYASAKKDVEEASDILAKTVGLRQFYSMNMTMGERKGKVEEIFSEYADGKNLKTQLDKVDRDMALARRLVFQAKSRSDLSDLIEKYCEKG